jgi:hypothetical protein
MSPIERIKMVNSFQESEVEGPNLVNRELTIETNRMQPLFQPNKTIGISPGPSVQNTIETRIYARTANGLSQRGVIRDVMDLLE